MQEKPMGAAGAAGAAAAFNNNNNHGPRSPGGASQWERPMTGNSNSPANPFGPHAELPSSRPVSPAVGNPAAAAAAAGFVAGAAAGAAAHNGMQRNRGPKPVDLTMPPPLSAVPPSPAGTEFSMNSISPGQPMPPSASAAAIVAAGGPASAVYRVQLDFAATMDDELDLKAGQLVRMLHEYDDGWVSQLSLLLGSTVKSTILTGIKTGSLHPDG
jgi:hypothetical protein